MGALDLTHKSHRIFAQPQKTYFEHFGCLAPDMARMSLRRLILSILAAWRQTTTLGSLSSEIERVYAENYGALNLSAYISWHL